MASNRIAQSNFQNRFVHEFGEYRLPQAIIMVLSEFAVRLNDNGSYPPVLRSAAMDLADIVNDLNNLPTVATSAPTPVVQDGIFHSPPEQDGQQRSEPPEYPDYVESGPDASQV